MLNLSKRELLLLKVFGALAGIFGLYFLIISPVINLKSNIENQSEKNRGMLVELQSIYNEYTEVQSTKKRYEQLLKNSKNIATSIEKIASDLNIKNNMAHNRDSQSKVQNKYTKISSDVKFEGIGMKEAIDFIHKIESSNALINISYLRISQAFKEKSTYDVTLKIDTYRTE